MDKMPPVAQFKMPTQGQPSDTGNTGAALPSNPTNQMPAVAQFKLPQSAQPAQETPQKNVFSTPLTNIASGNSDANIQHSIGAVKGLLKQTRDVAGVDANPVVKDMVSHSPAMQSALDTEKQAIEPRNLEQAKGRSETALGMQLVTGLTPGGEEADGANLASLPLKAKGLIGDALTGSKDAVLTAVSPRLTPKVASETPTKTVGLLKKIVPTSNKYLKNVADAVRPFFNSKGGFSENSQIADKAIGDEATSLFNNIGSKANYIYRELESSLNNTEIPHFIKTSDAIAQKRAQSIIDKFMEIAKSNGGKVQSLLKSRQEFDAWAQKEYPNLFDENKDGQAINALIKNVRNSANKFIGENAPEGVDVSQSLNKQTLLYDARDALREKAAKGELNQQGEIGTNSLQRFAGRHPTMVNTLKKGAALTATGLLGGEIAGHVINSK